MLKWLLDNFEIVIGLWFVYSAIRKAAGGADEKRRSAAVARTSPAPPPLPAPPVQPPPVQPPRLPSSPTPRAADRALGLDVAAANLRACRERAQASTLNTASTSSRLNSMNSVVRAADALATRCDDAMRRARDPATLGDAPTAATAANLRLEAASLSRASDILGLALAQREAERLGDMVPLADLVGTRLLSARSPRDVTPVVSVLGDVLGDRPPISMAARRWLPVAFVAVPPDIREHPWRWAFVARESWVDHFARDPVLAEQIFSLLSEPDPDLWEDHGHRVACELTGPWALELAADAATALSLGPAWGSALLADAARRTSAAHFSVRPDAAALPFGEHLPSDLRISLVVAVLDRGGWTLEAQRLEARWDELVPKPPTVPVHIPAGLALLPREILLEHCEELADRIATAPVPALQGTLASLASGARSGAPAAFEANAQATRDTLSAGDVASAAGGMATLPVDVLLAAMGGLVATPADGRALQLACEASLKRALDADAPRRAELASGLSRPDERRTTPRARVLRQALVLGELLTPWDVRIARSGA